jgi:hypothetical protein
VLTVGDRRRFQVAEDAADSGVQVWKEHQGKVDLRTAAMIVAIDKVALSYQQLGIFP